MTTANIDSNNDFINKQIGNESSITIRDTSFEEKGFSDVESSSLDTIATQQEKDVTETKKNTRRNRSETIKESNSDRMLKLLIQEQLELKEENEEDADTRELVDGLQQMEEETSYSDSENSMEEFRYHTRHQSHQSTMSSTHSFISSVSNYDLLLARLDNNSTAFAQNSTEDLRRSMEIEEEELQEDFDWGKE